MKISAMFLVVVTPLGTWAADETGSYLTHADPASDSLQQFPLEERDHFVVTPNGLWYDACLGALQPGDVRIGEGLYRRMDGSIKKIGDCRYTSVGRLVPVSPKL